MKIIALVLMTICVTPLFSMQIMTFQSRMIFDSGRLEDNKIEICLNDFHSIEDDVQELYQMILTKFDFSIFTAKLLDLTIKGKEAYSVCKNISQDDIMDYMKKHMAKCYNQLNTIAEDVKTIFVKIDVTLEEIIAAAKDIATKFPQIAEVCSNTE